jgi:hypothetical protein
MVLTSAAWFARSKLSCVVTLGQEENGPRAQHTVVDKL